MVCGTPDPKNYKKLYNNVGVSFINKKAPVRRLFCARRVSFNNYFLLYIKNSAANTAFKTKFPYTGGPEACPVAA